MSFSMFGDSPPGPLEPKFSFKRNAPIIEQNVSYTRALEARVEASRETTPAKTLGDADEDARFLRLAHEALVATTKETNLIVDPTIQDLLRRLQYALSPHGNPIKLSESIRANENGQLMIQNFYEGFPNLSNDIFTGSTNHPSNPESSGWNFLLDKEGRHKQRSESPEADDYSDSPQETGDRKFPCKDCPMSFRRSSDLKRHEKQHFKIPAHICPQCGKGFARRDALKRHMGTQTCKRNADKNLYLGNLDYLADKPVKRKR